MPLIAAMFLVSGAAALIYEVVWMRQLSLIFGITTVAVSTVLAIFMGGLAIGSVLFGRRADATARPLVLYALLEIGIGVYALLIPFLFDALRTPYIVLYRMDLPFGLLTLGRAFFGGIVLLPPTILMGGTLPVLARYLIQRYGDVGKQTGTLYFFNTLGAVIGCCVAGFYLIEHLGLIASTHVAAALNFGLAGVALALQRWMAPTAPHDAQSSEAATESHATLSPAAIRLVVMCIGLSGFISLASEVLWTRALPRYIYNSTYAYTTTLAVFLLGLAIGSLLYLLMPFRKSRPVLVFGLLEAGAGLGLLLSLHLFEDLKKVSKSIVGTEIDSFGDSLALMIVRCGLVLFLPAVCFGATLPLVTQMCARSLENVGGLVGRIYAVNTMGAVLGSLGVTFVLVPVIGMHWTLVGFITLLMLMAGALTVAGSPQRWLKGVSIVALCGVLFLTYRASGNNVFRETFRAYLADTIFYKDGMTDTVGVVQNRRDGTRVIRYSDLRGTASTSTFHWNFLLGHIPTLLHPGEPKTALNICFGVGNSLSAMAAPETIERIDSVELSPHVLEAAKFFWTNNDVINNPKINTIIDDGRNFVLASDQTYDIIELEPPAIFTAGVINLYTRDFYEDVYDRLAPDGIFVQWMPSGAGPMRDEQMLLRAFYEVFPHATIWKQLTAHSPLLAIGTKEPFKIDYQLLSDKMSRRYVRDDLALASIHNPVDVLAMFLFGPKELEEYVRDVPPVTENKTVVDFSTPRDLSSGYGFQVVYAEADRDLVRAALSANSERVLNMRTSILPYLTNLGDEDPEELDRRIIDHGVLTFVELEHKLIPESEWNRWATSGESDIEDSSALP